MNYNIKSKGTENSQKFSEVTCGEVFIDSKAYMKIRCITGFLGGYNSIRIIDGEPKWFSDDKVVVVPDDSKLNITK